MTNEYEWLLGHLGTYTAIIFIIFLFQTHHAKYAHLKKPREHIGKLRTVCFI